MFMPNHQIRYDTLNSYLLITSTGADPKTTIVGRPWRHPNYHEPLRRPVKTKPSQGHRNTGKSAVFGRQSKRYNKCRIHCVIRVLPAIQHPNFGRVFGHLTQTSMYTRSCIKIKTLENVDSQGFHDGGSDWIRTSDTPGMNRML